MYSSNLGGVAQLVRALPCHGKGRGFEPRRSRQYTHCLITNVLTDYVEGWCKFLTLKNLNLNLNSEKTKDFAAGLVALIFVLTAGYLALNKFNSRGTSDLGQGGDMTVGENGAQTANYEHTDGTVAGTNSVGGWVANDYKNGDVQKGSYTVVSGDTLWEISEAVYGNGAMWTQILSANSGSIGYLANGSQALIVPGQVLALN